MERGEERPAYHVFFFWPAVSTIFFFLELHPSTESSVYTKKMRPIAAAHNYIRSSGGVKPLKRQSEEVPLIGRWFYFGFCLGLCFWLGFRFQAVHAVADDGKGAKQFFL